MNPLATALNDRLQEIAPFLFRVLSRKGKESYFPKSGILAQSMEARETAINATIGIALEDDRSPMHLDAIGQRVHLDPKRVFPYAGCSGLPELRQQWKKLQLEKNPALAGKTTSLPVVTCALSHGLSIVSKLFLDPGDTVIIADKYWGNYNMLVQERLDVHFDLYPFFAGEGLNLAGLRERLQAAGTGKKVLIMNFPNNPAGYTPTKIEMRELVQLIKESAEAGNDIVVICDDAYFGLVYEADVDTQSLFAYLAGLHERVLAVKVDGPTKEDYVWGFRVGFVTYAAGKNLSEEALRILEDKTAGGIRSSISSSPHISQSLLLEAFADPDYAREKREKYALLQSRYKKVKAILAANRERYVPYFRPLPFNSGYFMCVELAPGLDGNAVRRTLIEHFQTGVIFIRGVIRLAYSAVPETRLETLFENLRAACEMNLHA
ncbi:MAG: aminotransferase class I/II-fold pyridoxal phosphate-dependent enzyme [Candidatus Marinimicrobia bacterium]|nr:aminotransferase class I/II-fold pyridoxal phosphate-dependent enzyme [Candidatus Neomarinimicrobiota bacterium]MDD4961876.1 aminotransferase class I/II-fold pyridoxal phosphate-dependent enzyme [Candidatus Neomarinimicrobiota bacterium]MDD5710438.1 aminotransferase class I/II-fold pyridoxal phosphate-dependent enzyme [Candidatus Neomarinimicrobiota bacterium]